MKRKERIPDAIYERGYVYNFHFHLIWVTKYRNPAFTTPELVQEMKDILLRIAQLNDVTVEELEVMPEHVHMLIINRFMISAYSFKRVTIVIIKTTSRRMQTMEKHNRFTPFFVFAFPSKVSCFIYIPTFLLDQISA